MDRAVLVQFLHFVTKISLSKQSKTGSAIKIGSSFSKNAITTNWKFKCFNNFTCSNWRLTSFSVYIWKSPSRLLASLLSEHGRHFVDAGPTAQYSNAVCCVTVLYSTALAGWIEEEIRLFYVSSRAGSRLGWAGWVGRNGKENGHPYPLPTTHPPHRCYPPILPPSTNTCSEQIQH